jgi:hypothetical protein
MFLAFVVFLVVLYFLAKLVKHDHSRLLQLLKEVENTIGHPVEIKHVNGKPIVMWDELLDELRHKNPQLYKKVIVHSVLIKPYLERYI